MSQLTVADGLVYALSLLESEYIFGVSGANIEFLHDAVYRHQKQQHQKHRHQNKPLTTKPFSNIFCKSEMGAAFMADAYSRQTGKLGVCCATSGGGALNLCVGVAEARASGVPILALVGCPATSQVGNGAFQEASGGKHQVDQFALWQSVSKQVQMVEADRFWDQLSLAIESAFQGHPGPSTLLLPRDIQDQVIPLPPSDWLNQINDAIKPRADVLSDYNRLIKTISNAQSPVIIAGPCMQNCEALIELSEQFKIAVATTLESSNAFAQDHPHFIGMVGVAGHISTHDYIKQSDLIINLGQSFGSMTCAPLMPYIKDKNIWIIHTNLQSVPCADTAKCFETNAITWTEKLVEASKTSKLLPIAKNSDFPKLKTLPLQWLDSETVKTNDSLGNTHAVQALQPFIHRFSQVMMDAGNCAATAAHYLSLKKGQRSSIALGMGGMGYAVTASIGAVLAEPNKATIALCGDGAMLMLGLELHTAIELKLPILWVVFNDAKHGMCTSRQRLMFDGHIINSQYQPVDFTQVAQGLDESNTLWTARATSVEEINKAMKSYFSDFSDKPGVLELIISKEEIPPFFPFRKEI